MYRDGCVLATLDIAKEQIDLLDEMAEAVNRGTNQSPAEYPDKYSYLKEAWFILDDMLDLILSMKNLNLSKSVLFRTLCRVEAIITVREYLFYKEQLGKLEVLEDKGTILSLITETHQCLTNVHRELERIQGETKSYPKSDVF